MFSQSTLTWSLPGPGGFWMRYMFVHLSSLTKVSDVTLKDFRDASRLYAVTQWHKFNCQHLSKIAYHAKTPLRKLQQCHDIFGCRLNHCEISEKKAWNKPKTLTKELLPKLVDAWLNVPELNVLALGFIQNAAKVQNIPVILQEFFIYCLLETYHCLSKLKITIFGGTLKIFKCHLRAVHLLSSGHETQRYQFAILQSVLKTNWCLSRAIKFTF